MPIKILYVIDKMVRAGAQKNLYQVVSGLDRDLFLPRLCCLLYPGPLADRLINDGVKVRSLQLTNIMGYRFPQAVRGLSRLIRREKIDLIHSYLFAANIVSPWAGFFNGIPVITSRGDTGFWKKNRHIWANRLGNLLTARITANSQAVVDYLLNREKAPPEKVVLIHKGWGMGKISRPSLKKNTSREKIILGCLGNIRPVKGYEFLLNALKTLKDSPTHFELQIGGRVLDPQYYRRLQEIAAHPFLRDKILFRGEIADPSKFLSEIDVLVIPSLSEGFPNVLLEAMAEGRAVVATEVGAAWEVIKNGEDGFLVPPADVSVLARRIHELIKDRSLIVKLGKRARQKVAREFSAAKMLREFQDLYRRVLG